MLNFAVIGAPLGPQFRRPDGLCAGVSDRNQHHAAHANRRADKSLCPPYAGVQCWFPDCGEPPIGATAYSIWTVPAFSNWSVPFAVWPPANGACNSRPMM